MPNPRPIGDLSETDMPDPRPMGYAYGDPWETDMPVYTIGI